MSVTLHTSQGPLKLELFVTQTPKTSYNFLALAASGQYTSSSFHRMIPSFILQGGSPPSGTIKDSISIYGEPFENEIVSGLTHHTRGVLSMANSSKPCTNGSQFFITFDKAHHLDGQNTVFGQLVDGWETLDKIEGLAVDKKNRLIEKVEIQNVVIHANPLADRA